MNNGKYLQLLKQSIGFTQEPPTIDEALDSPYYLKNIFRFVYPFWREKLHQLYPNNITTASTYVVLYGCIGGGKSYFSQIVLLYDIIKMACCEDFAGFNDIDASLGIYIKCANIYKQKSLEFVDFLNDAVFGGRSPFFANELAKGNKLLTNLKIQATGAREKDIVSNDVSHFWLSETSNMRTEVATALIDAADSRLTSRFLDSEGIFTHLILDSSTTGVDSATDIWLRDSPKSHKAFKVHVNSWNVAEGLGRFFNYGSFEVYTGDSTHSPFIVPDHYDPLQRSILDPDKFLICPNELKDEAVRNLILFLQEKAGISTSSATKFFTDHTKLEQAFCIPIDYDPVIAVKFYDPNDTLMSKLGVAVQQLPRDRKLYVRVDCGVKTDLFGLALGYSDGIQRVDLDGIPTERLRIRIPIVVGISRYEGEETNISKIEDFILQVAQDRHVALVLTDQYQSTELRQIMMQHGIEAKLESVDRTDEAYVISKNYIYSGLVEIANNPLTYKEAKEVEQVGPRKVDHPYANPGVAGSKKGSKDTLDAVVGLIKKLVELGPEEVLDPSSDSRSDQFVDLYEGVNKWHERSGYTHYSDYLL